MAQGSLFDMSIGYENIKQRKRLSLSTEEYLTEIERQFGPDFYIENYIINEKLSNENKLVQQFQFEIEDVIENNEIYFNPFIRKFFNSNPFKAEERNYPIDFGYPRQYNYSMSIIVPEGYRIKNLPEKLGLKLPEELGFLVFKCKYENGRVNVFFQFKINETQYGSEVYNSLKTIFGKAVDAQNQSIVVFEKI